MTDRQTDTRTDRDKRNIYKQGYNPINCPMLYAIAVGQITKIIIIIHSQIYSHAVLFQQTVDK